MKIIDSSGVEIASPDLTKGYLKQETQTVRHDAVEGVEEVSHYEYKTYPNGGRDRWKVVDVPGVAAQDAYDEEVDVQRYVLYTTEELAAQEEARKKAEAREKLPETGEALQKENKLKPRKRQKKPLPPKRRKRQSWKPCRAAWTLWKRQTTTLCL